MKYLEEKIESIKSFCDFIETSGEKRPKAPLEVNLEVSNLCNFKCAMCNTFSKLNPHRHKLLRVEDRKFQDFDISQLRGLIKNSLMAHCFGYGEVTIHPRYGQILSQLSDFGVLVDFFTNAQEMDKKFSEQLLHSNVGKVTISFSGSTKGEYENVYLGGDFKTVIKNIKTLSDLKKSHGRSFPRVEVNSLGFKHHVARLPDFVRLMSDAGVNAITLRPLRGVKNIPHLHQHIAVYREEIEGLILKEAHELAKELGMRLNTKPFESCMSVEHGQNESEVLSKMINGKIIDPGYVPIDEIGKLSEQVPTVPSSKRNVLDHGNPMRLSETDLEEYLSVEDHIPDQNIACMEPFQRFYIKNNGDVRPCCFGERVNMGNIYSNSGEDIWKGVGYRKIQDGILDNQYSTTLCGNCLKRGAYPKRHHLLTKVYFYKEWLWECHGVAFPKELLRRINVLPDSFVIQQKNSN